MLSFCIYVLLLENVIDLTFWILLIDFFQLNLKKIVDEYVVVRNNTERNCVSFTPPVVVISCKTVEQYHNQDIDIDAVKIQNTSVSTRIFHIVLL